MTSRNVAEPSRELVDGLVCLAAEITQMEPATVCEGANYPATGARHAIWQVLQDRYSTLVIGRAFNRNHSSVGTGIRRSERRCAVDPDHAYLVAELARRMREGFAGGTTRERAQASLRAMDREIEVASSILVDLTRKLATLREARASLSDLLVDFHLVLHDSEPVITRVPA